MAERTQRERIRKSAAEPASPPETAARAGGTPRGPRRAHDRAQKAWQWVNEAATTFGKEEKIRYAALARKLPGHLQVSGLGQTMAFLFSKAKAGAKNPEGMLFKHVASHLLVKPPGGASALEQPEAMMSVLLNLSPSQYRNATREAMAVAEWIKRFAAGRLGEKP